MQRILPEHKEETGHVIIFDYFTQEINNKLHEIRKLLDIIIEQNKIDKDSILYNNNENAYIIEMRDKSNCDIISKNYLIDFIKLVNIMINDYYYYPNYSHFFNIEAIYRFLLNRIESTTGFFCEISNEIHFI